MKRSAIIIFLAILLVMGILYFIPVTRQKQVFVASTFQNIISSLSVPGNWTKWNSTVRNAWEKDSARCSFTKDSLTGSSTITIPGKKISIKMRTYLLYDVQTSGGGSSLFSVSIIPYIGNGQPRSQHNSYIAYAEPTNLLFKLFPLFDNKLSAGPVADELRSYLEDNSRFYGAPIELKTSSDSFFITRKIQIPSAKLIRELPRFFDDAERFALTNQCTPGTKNISVSKMKGDSLEVLAGVTINKSIDGNDTFNVMQLPPGQIVAVAHFQGRFGDRATMYAGMEKYLLDHQLVQSAAPYEKYISELPVSDTSPVKIDLTYPLRY